MLTKVTLFKFLFTLLKEVEVKFGIFKLLRLLVVLQNTNTIAACKLVLVKLMQTQLFSVTDSRLVDICGVGLVSGH